MDTVIHLQDLPIAISLEIAKKLNTQAFVRSIRSCKWAKSLIEIKRHTFVKNLEKCVDLSSLTPSQISAYRHFKLSNVEIRYYTSNKLLKLLQPFKTANIYVDKLTLLHSIAITEVFEYLKPKRCQFWTHDFDACTYVRPGLETITFLMDDEHTVEQIDIMCDTLVGKSSKLIGECFKPLTFLHLEKFVKAVANRGHDQELEIKVNRGVDHLNMLTDDAQFNYRYFEFRDRLYRVPGRLHFYLYKAPGGRFVVAGAMEADNDGGRFYCVHVRSVEELETRFIPLLEINNEDIELSVANHARKSFK